VDETKLFQVINALLEKTRCGLIEWGAWGTHDLDWGTRVGKVWVTICGSNAHVDNGYTFQVLKDGDPLIKVCTTANCLDMLYHLVAEKASTENKILDQLFAELQNISPKHDDSYYKD